MSAPVSKFKQIVFGSAALFSLTFAGSLVSAQASVTPPPKGAFDVNRADRKEAPSRKQDRKIERRGAADAPAPQTFIGGVIPIDDQKRWFHGLLNEFEGRYASSGNSSFRWEGESWYGGDYNRLWLKSEGTETRGRVTDGDQELLYGRALTSFFNVQTGVRLDLDSGPVRAWGAVGLEGLTPYGFQTAATFYFSDRGAAGKLEGFYDILLTNRLILQPQAELNFYSAADRARGVGEGLSDIDAGLRLRYELWRKFAPYVGVTYDGPIGQARRMARADYYHSRQRHSYRAGKVPRFTFGIRSWF